MKGSEKKGMKVTTKIYIGIGIVVVLVVLAEMSISVFFANKYAAQHGNQETTLHMH